MNTQTTHGGRSVFKTLAIAIGLATLVALPFKLFHKPNLTGPVIFAAASKQAGEVSPVKCPFNLRGDRFVTCYRVYTRQDRRAPQSRLISSLAVMVSPTGGAKHSDPFLYLEGGPGYSAVQDSDDAYGKKGWVRRAYASILTQGRAVLFVDTRGLGFAEPTLHCPAAQEATWQALKLPTSARNSDTLLDADVACLDALTAKGVTLSQYQSAEVAKDLKALRLGLNISQWNLYGVSYGAQIALNLLAEDQAGVRAVIFDSPSYAHYTVFQDDQAAFDRVLTKIDQWCQGEAAKQCNDLTTSDRLETLLGRLRTDPLSMRGYPFGKPLLLTDREAMLVLHSGLYSTFGWSTFITNLTQMERQNNNYFSSLSNWSMDWRDSLYWSYRNDAFSWVVHDTTACREYDFTASPKASRWPVYSADEARYQRQICAALGISWQGTPIKAADFYGVPTLVFSGGRDVITPPAYGRTLAHDMGGFYFLHQQKSHGLLFLAPRGCITDSATQFLTTLSLVSDEDKKTNQPHLPETCAPYGKTIRLSHFYETNKP